MHHGRQIAIGTLSVAWLAVFSFAIVCHGQDQAADDLGLKVADGAGPSRQWEVKLSYDRYTYTATDYKSESLRFMPNSSVADIDGDLNGTTLTFTRTTETAGGNVFSNGLQFSLREGTLDGTVGVDDEGSESVHVELDWRTYEAMWLPAITFVQASGLNLTLVGHVGAAYLSADEHVSPPPPYGIAESERSGVLGILGAGAIGSVTWPYVTTGIRLEGDVLFGYTGGYSLKETAFLDVPMPPQNWSVFGEFGFMQQGADDDPYNGKGTYWRVGCRVAF